MTDLQLSGFDKDGKFWLKAEEFNDDAYMAALEIGKSHMRYGGITFNQLAMLLKEYGFSVFNKFEPSDERLIGRRRNVNVQEDLDSCDNDLERPWVGFTHFFYKNFENPYAKELLSTAYDKELDRQRKYIRARNATNETHYCMLSTDAYLRVLEFYELLEARRNAKLAYEQSHQAIKLSDKAVKFAVITLLVTAIIGVIQIIQGL